MAIFETVGAFLLLAGLIFNSVKTQKMGKQYDELNLTASDYTLYIDVSASHRSEFEEVYERQLTEEQPRYSRGFLFKQYLEKKLKIRGVEAARVDLVFDNAKMINLLEARGSAIKTENFAAIAECELQIEGLKEFQYNSDVVGAFVTYEKNEDIKKVQGVFGGTEKPEEGDGVPPFHAQRPVDPSNVKWKNMQVKAPERKIRGLLVCLTLLALLYFSFLIQVMISNWRFDSETFEKIDCGAYKAQNNKSMF